MKSVGRNGIGTDGESFTKELLSKLETGIKSVGGARRSQNHVEEDGLLESSCITVLYS